MIQISFRDSVTVELDHGVKYKILLLRKKDLTEKPKKKISYDNMWSNSINDNYGYLKLGTFVTWKMTFDWKAYLDDFFKKLHEKGINYLIIDIRDNEGGMTEVTKCLTHLLANKNGELIPRRKHLAYKKVSENLKPYLSTWNNWFYNLSLWTKRIDERYRTPRFSIIKKKVSRNPGAFQGETFLIVNSANSSATFMLAENCKINNYATLIGTETGGTKMGINGGQIFFLKLPNTKIEIDIPLIGYYPIENLPDEGIIPDISIPYTIEDHIDKTDSQLNYIIKNLIQVD